MIILRYFLILGLLSPFCTHACMNSYSLELHPDQFTSVQQRIDYYQTELNQAQQHQNYKTVQERNDYAVLLILSGQYQKAINELQMLEQAHPNLPKTAINLGTAYELAGNILLAKKWIRLGIQRDPNIHEGSEWIHLNILNAKQQHADVKWLNQNPLLGIDFGQSLFPKPNNEQTGHVDHQQLVQIYEQAKLQLQERRQFVFEHDPITARLYYDLANIELSLNEGKWMSRVTSNPTVVNLMRIAQKLGLEQDAIISRRIDMLESNPFKRVWLQFKERVENMILKIK